jgi:site-specific recombinase XerD
MRANPVTEYLDQFIQMLRSEKYYSPHTCKNYRRDLELFRSFLSARDIAPSPGPQEPHHPARTILYPQLLPVPDS